MQPPLAPGFGPAFGLAATLACGVCAGCGGDAVSFSAPVGIHLKTKSADTMNGVVTDEKSINTESGNPYGAFIGDAVARIGHDPSMIAVDRAELLLGAGSTGVMRLGEVFTGAVELLFQMNDTNNSYPVASGMIDAAAGGGPVALGVLFHSDDVPDADYVKLLGGGFKLVVRGSAEPAFQDRGADVDLQVTMTFSAFE